MKYNHPGNPRTFDGVTDSQVLRAAAWDIERMISFYAARLTRRSLTPLARAAARAASTLSGISRSPAARVITVLSGGPAQTVRLRFGRGLPVCGRGVSRAGPGQWRAGDGPGRPGPAVIPGEAGRSLREDRFSDTRLRADGQLLSSAAADPGRQPGGRDESHGLRQRMRRCRCGR